MLTYEPFFVLNPEKGGLILKNAFTVDVEDWYQTSDFNFDLKLWDNFEDRVEYGTNIILDLLSEHHLKATFFVLGCVAAKHPGLVLRIVQAGHELASHGNWHRMVTQQTREEFRQDVRSAKLMLEDISGIEVNLFRAPSWSISADTLWALEVLEEEGYIGDSSVQPFATPLSGIKGAPVVPYHPVIGGKALRLVEFPPTVLEIGNIRVPFSGGFYLRAMPSLFFNLALRRVNQKRAGMVYVHPWELDVKQPRSRVSPLIWLSHYLNIERTEGKLGKLLKRFEFVPLGELIRDGEYPALPVIKKCIEKKVRVANF